MRFVVASANERHVESCRNELSGIDEIEVRSGSVPEVSAGCDAVILAWPLACERYGGVPELGRAQVLANELADGAPSWVVSTPPVPAVPEAESIDDAAVQAAVLRALRGCTTALVQEFGTSDLGVLIHLEGAAIDRAELSPIMRALRELTRTHV